MAQLPTGGGKTVIFAAIAEEFVRRGESVLVLAHREELITQAASKLETVRDSRLSLQHSHRLSPGSQNIGTIDIWNPYTHKRFPIAIAQPIREFATYCSKTCLCHFNC